MMSNDIIRHYLKDNDFFYVFHIQRHDGWEWYTTIHRNNVTKPIIIIVILKVIMTSRRRGKSHITI